MVFPVFRAKLTVFHWLQCMVELNDRVIRTYYVVPVACRVANAQSHFHQLRFATGVNACQEDVSHSMYGLVLSVNMVANVVIVLSILYVLQFMFKSDIFFDEI